jgi:hypothetical protein
MREAQGLARSGWGEESQENDEHPCPKISKNLFDFSYNNNSQLLHSMTTGVKSTSSAPGAANFSNLGKAFVSYGTYHHNIVYGIVEFRNKIIHIICIPLITTSLFALFTYVPIHFDIAGHEVGGFHIGMAFALIYYLLLGPGPFVVVGECR